MGTRKISIIILTKNNSSTIGKVLLQIKSQEVDDDFEIIIVDSGSSDGTVDLVSEYDVKLYKIPPNEFGHGKTRNLASAYASGDYLVYLSADAIPKGRTWLRNLVNGLVDKDTGATFGRQIPHKNSSSMERFFITKNYPQSGNDHSIKEFDMNGFFSNVNSAIKRSVWNNIKFNESLIMSEDYEWAKCALESGYRIRYVPDAAVYHSHNYDLTRVFKRYFDSGVSFSQMGLKPGVMKNGICYFIEEMRFIGKENILKIPYAICYDMFKLAGYLAGIHYKSIPSYALNHLSMHAYYWKTHS